MFPAELSVEWWWYLFPGYLTIWSIIFGSWNFINGQAMFKAFKIEFDVSSIADAFVVKNSAARYLGIAAAMVVGIWLIGTPEAIFTALIARLVMDILDLVAGLQTGLLENRVTGTIQSFLMFLLPNLIALTLILVV